VKTVQNSQRSKASNAVMVTSSRTIRGVMFFSGLEACNLVTAAMVSQFDFVLKQLTGTTYCMNQFSRIIPMRRVGVMHFICVPTLMEGGGGMKGDRAV
jgi:hypothetical protein